MEEKNVYTLLGYGTPVKNPIGEREAVLVFVQERCKFLRYVHIYMKVDSDVLLATFGFRIV